MAKKWYSHRCQQIGDRRYGTCGRVTHPVILLQEFAHVGIEGVDRGVHSGVEGDQEFGHFWEFASVYLSNVQFRWLKLLLFLISRCLGRQILLIFALYVSKEERSGRAEVADVESDPEEREDIFILVVYQWCQVVIDGPNELISEQYQPKREGQLLVREPQAHDSLLNDREGVTGPKHKTA